MQPQLLQARCRTAGSVALVADNDDASAGILGHRQPMRTSRVQPPLPARSCPPRSRPVGGRRPRSRWSGGMSTTRAPAATSAERSVASSRSTVGSCISFAQGVARRAGPVSWRVVVQRWKSGLRLWDWPRSALACAGSLWRGPDRHARHRATPGPLPSAPPATHYSSAADGPADTHRCDFTAK